MAPDPHPDWRDPRPYSSLRGVDRAGLMWEWLRRDRDYIAWHARASVITGSHPSHPPDPGGWGLCFRGATRCRSARRPHHLARGFRSRDASCPRRSGRGSWTR
ncbi:transcriptional regulator domain-containing protein [Sphingomonas natans]|uniref:transcriptional regulator domain-containing protein n=1 Tax=Sphingomonas natans TaxID=3063330 RepID=UPI003D667092